MKKRTWIVLSLFVCLGYTTGLAADNRPGTPMARNAPKMVDVDVTILKPVGQHPKTIRGAVYADPDRSPAERALDLIRRMTFEEKLDLTGGWNRFLVCGVERLGIRPVSMADASQGVRLQTALVKDRSTSFPGMLSLASTWNQELAERFGHYMGQECRALGVDILLGPGVNMQRLSVGGRNFEYMGEDPWLTATMSTAYVRGLQGEGIIATPKHFVGNDQDFCRHIADSRIDERTLREVYLQPWEMLVKEGRVGGIMTGNNLINGLPAAMNRSLLNGVMRGEFGFDGLAMTDWQNTGYYPDMQQLVLSSGETLLMPENVTFRKYVEEQAAVSPERRAEIEILLEKMIFPTLYTLFRTGIYDRPFNVPALFDTFEKHKQLARQCGEEAIVLLKNENGILPIGRSKKILLTGGDELHSGTGSGYVVGYDHISYADGLRDIYGENLVVEANPDDRSVRSADVVLFRLNKAAGEGKDIPYEEPADQLNELRGITKLNKNVVVLINACNTVPMDWLHGVKGVLWCYFLGQERGAALAGVVSGEVCPSGRLPFTVERSFSDSPDPTFNYLGDKPYWNGNNQYKNYWLGNESKPIPGFSPYVKPGQILTVPYKEGVHIGYRWYDKQRIPVCYPFGFGLSYTEFAYTGIHVDDRLDSEGYVIVTVGVRNTGKREGAEVVQLYVSAPGKAVDQPVKALKGYAKVTLRPGETKHVPIRLDRRSFSYWDVAAGKWVVEPGTFVVRAGGASDKLPLEARIMVER